MGNNYLMQLVQILAIIALIVILVLTILALIDSVKMTDGCFMRYNTDDDNKAIGGDRIESTVNLMASGNYVFKNELQPDGTMKHVLDKNHYGEWLDTKISASQNKEIKLRISGEVSLCRAYLPKNNLQSISNLDNSNNLIPIPRMEEGKYLSLIFDAKTSEWRNITQIFPKDKIEIAVSPDRQPIKDSNGNIISDVNNITAVDAFSQNIISADCTQGKREYSPICGRYSVYGSSTYVSGCWWDPCYERIIQHRCSTNCSLYTDGGWVDEGKYCPGVTHACRGNQNTDYRQGDCIGKCTGKVTIAPEPYKYDATYTYPWAELTSLSSLLSFPAIQCTGTQQSCVSTSNIPNFKFWFTSSKDNQYHLGLAVRKSTDEVPSNATFLGNSAGSDYALVKISKNKSSSNASDLYILEDPGGVQSPLYLQYKFLRIQDIIQNSTSSNTGGYVLNIKQTKCVRSNGEFTNDTFENRGLIEYVIMPNDKNPNTTQETLSISKIIPSDISGNASITPSTAGKLWLRIKNKPEDYKDSFGQYSIKFLTSKPEAGRFYISILNPIFDGLKTRVKEASNNIFKGMVCYKMTPTSSCISFFNYIKTMLTIYIMVYGAMFLLGMTQIKQTDLVIRIIKIAIVSGLLNDKTFDFFNNYVLDFFTEFSDSIISDMSGYSLFSYSNKVSNPFMFLDSLLSKVLFSGTFFAQILGLLALGMNGVLYFILVFIALMILIISTLKAIATYIMAFMAISILIGLAPLFLTFMLFETTKYLFDNWLKFTIKYMLEPVVLMVGIIILTQLFTIYLDFVMGYSVCWKCVMPFKIPFPKIPGFNPAFLNVPLFCIYWFAPWGYDAFSGSMGLNMQHIVALVMISYCIWGYADLAGKITTKITGIFGISATDMGEKMVSAFKDSAMEKAGFSKEARAKVNQKTKERAKNIKAAAKKK